jgi:hypothetical protein
LNPQLACVQVGTVFGPPTHALPHVPQLETLEFKLTHCPSQSLSGEQLLVHAPLAQTWPDPHCFPHPPQFAAFDCVFTHSPLQSVNPLVHTTWQAPFEHAALPPTGGWHGVPQAPQLRTSLRRFTHWPLQAV